MGKHTVTSRLVKCPICNIEVKSRGLHAHLRLVHPNSDIKKELRKKVLSPLRPGERVIFSLSLWKGYEPKPSIEDMYLIKHAGLVMEDVEFLADLFAVWAETGSISQAIVETQEESGRFIIRQGEENELDDEEVDEIKY
jgi:hypothetical protein